MPIRGAVVRDASLLADVETPAGFTIDAVRELLPIVDDLDKILARYTVLAEATQRVNRLREQMIAAYVGTPGEQAISAAFDGMGRLSTELEETLKYIDGCSVACVAKQHWVCYVA